MRFWIKIRCLGYEPKEVSDYTCRCRVCCALRHAVPNLSHDQRSISCVCVALLKDSRVKNRVGRNTNVCFLYFKNYECSERRVSRYFLFTAVCMCGCHFLLPPITVDWILIEFWRDFNDFFLLVSSNWWRAVEKYCCVLLVDYGRSFL